MDIKLIRKHLNKVANIVKMVEELDPQAVILPNIDRSLQLDPYSCGLQSVYMILNYYRKAPSLEKLGRQLDTDFAGTGLSDIKRVFQKYGLKVKVIGKAKLKHLKDAIHDGHPVLVSLFEGGHWSVVYGFSSTHMFVCDPSVVTNIWCRIPKEKFREDWDEWAMVVSEWKRLGRCKF